MECFIDVNAYMQVREYRKGEETKEGKVDHLFRFRFNIYQRVSM